uniref:Uncharacterized protein n=1 Tax=Timema bartmani TaxID=61472 RepID=A0A7R9HX96_9NEOP|nr:unnamed protein product [Timema bartmani]
MDMKEETGEVRLVRNIAQQWGRGFDIRLVRKGRSTEHSRVEMDLDAGGVTGYSDQVQFPVTPKQRSDKDRRCSQQAVIRLELGGQMQIASLTMEYKEDPPRLWTFHMSDSEKAGGYGAITITNSSFKGSLEMHVVNQQLRVPTTTPSHSQWMSVRIVDSTAKKLSKVELTLSMRGNSLRWQDGRLAHDFSAPPGLFYDNESIRNKSIIYVGLNRVIGADWRSGTGLCKVIVKLMDNEDQCDGKMMNCDPNAYCKFTRKSYRCSCKKGWEGDGKKCRDINECRLQNGGCVHICHNYPGSYKCSCRPGFATDPFDPHNCVDVDECHIKNGGCKERCINTIGSFSCLCAQPGHTSSSCIVENSLCTANGCHQNCAFVGRGEVKCSCWQGYQLNSTDRRSCMRTCRIGNGGCQHHCLDTDQGVVCTCQHKYLLGHDGRTCSASCSVNNGGCHKRCTNTDVGVTCSCPGGYVLNEDGKTCVDIDECSVNQGGCQHSCVNNIGSYECICPKGYKLNAIDEKTCVDVDECTANNTCEHLCSNLPGSYRCNCRNGYRLFGMTHCGDYDECSLGNGGCQHICVNTPGSFYCSTHHDIARTNSNSTDSLQLTGHGKLFYQGIHCSQREDAQRHAKEIVSKMSETVAKNCSLKVTTVECLDTRKVMRKHGGEVIRVEECIPGEFWNITTHFCDLCPKDTYQNNRGQMFCVQCPVGSSTDNHGSSDINDCKRRICSSYIHDLQGFIESPNFPGEYPNNVECTWIMKPPKGRRLLFIVAHVDLAGDKCQDFLVMRKNKSPYSVVTYEACKTSERPIAFTAQSRKLWIQFRSDSRNSSGGFHIPFVTYNGKDQHLLNALMEVIAQPINYYKYASEQRKMFPTSFIRLMTPKEVESHVSHFILMISDRMNPRSRDWAVTIDFLPEVAIISLSNGSNVKLRPGLRPGRGECFLLSPAACDLVAAFYDQMLSWHQGVKMCF